MARLRRAGRHLAHDGGHGSIRLPGTVALNSEVCAHYPQIIEAGNQRHWEWSVGHGTTNSVLLNEQTESEERALIPGT